uniref:Fibronectin type-II domain-containing protein n=1 Tax=Poecilia latipinna TaxID=48699 RepID=A0A3B3U4P0_9TELE
MPQWLVALFNHSYFVSFCPDTTVIVTSLNGDPCHFPFVFLGTLYNQCTNVGRTDFRFWCATTDNYDRDQRGGLCPDLGERHECKNLFCIYHFMRW